MTHATIGGDDLTLATVDLFDADAVGHAFTTRVDAEGKEVSFRSDHLQVAQNLQRISRQLGMDPGRLYRVRQIHSDRVVVVEQGTAANEIASIEADALLTSAPGHFLAVQTADCVPVLLWDPRRSVVAAIHAGWRGIVGGVIQRTTEAAAARFGCQPEDFRAAIGPAIGVCCYEVSAEVATRFVRWPRVVDRRRGERPHLDLTSAVGQILGGVGVPQAQIVSAGVSTCCRGELFYSYRIEGPDTGRQLALIGVR